MTIFLGQKEKRTANTGFAMFKAFKTKGFNIEDTHLSDIDRIDKLVAVVSIAFTWLIKPEFMYMKT